MPSGGSRPQHQERSVVRRIERGRFVEASFVVDGAELKLSKANGPLAVVLFAPAEGIVYTPIESALIPLRVS